MHELALTEGIISIVNSEAKKQGFQSCRVIKIRIGELSGIIPDCLMEFFPIASKGTMAENAKLELLEVKAAFSCLDCGYQGPIPKGSACCPDCGGTAIRMTAGREFYVESLEVE